MKKILVYGLLLTGALCLGACGKQETVQPTVVSSNTVESVSADVTPVETQAETTVSDDSAEDTYVAVEETGEEMGEDKETTEEESAEVVEALEGTGREDLLVGTKVGISGTNCYVMIDGEGILFDFNGLGMATEEYTDGVLTGAHAFVQNVGTYKYLAYCGEKNADRAGWDSLGTETVGEFSVNIYYQKQAGVYEVYCPALDSAVFATILDEDFDKESDLDLLKEDILGRMAYFNANTEG